MILEQAAAAMRQKQTLAHRPEPDDPRPTQAGRSEQSRESSRADLSCAERCPQRVSYNIALSSRTALSI